MFSRRNRHFLIAAKPERRSRQPQNSGQHDETAQEHGDFAENWEKLLEHSGLNICTRLATGRELNIAGTLVVDPVHML